jgi:hypothetical protein
VNAPFLTQAEIDEIVAPLKRCDAVCRWFAKNGFTFKKRPNGMPLISRSHFDAVTSGQVNSSETKDATQLPNISGFINQYQKKN